ncbi:MAG: ATP-dependent DNA helicase RecG [Myxococcaceae bacterium]|nr:ATP-dependent DNA helicase RecG [Myxococcaceae bacterium]
MSSSPHPLAVLVGPLTFATAKGFAKLSQVKGLRALLEGALQRPGVPADTRAAVSAQLDWVDHADLPTRKNALLHVLQALRRSGLPLDELPSEPPRPSLTLGDEAPAAPPRAGPPVAAPPSAPRAPKVAKPRRAKAAKPAEDAEPAPRLMSIAPREGPLATPLGQVGWRVNPRLLGLLKKKGVHKVGDVLFLLPRVYEDRRQLKSIAQLRAGERGTVIAEVRRAEEVRGRGGRKTFRAVLGDRTGTIAATYFQTGPWLKAKFPLGQRLVVSGEVRQSSHGWEMPHPEVEPADDLQDSPIHFHRIVPVYPGFERHEQRSLRELAFKIAERFAHTIEEPLPEGLRAARGLLGLGEALKALHFPAGTEDLERLNAHQSAAHQRLAYDELFFLQLGMALRRQGVKVLPGVAFDVAAEKLTRARGLLPFVLTGAQARVVEQLTRDMARPEPMNRLLQGDVGSGKTAVALIATAVALQNGAQVAIMAPTEILAEQHARSFSKWVAPLGAKVALVTGGATAAERARTRAGLADGTLSVAVGTHALIQDGVDFAKLGLVVIDEQHRFGVIQRHALMAKGARPDVLVMTATPIPRTLAMTLYGDLDVSVIDELPPGRTPIETKVYVEKARGTAYAALQAELEKGHQAYVVYPLVEESEKVDMLDATRGAEAIRAQFPRAKVGLLHGRMKNDEKEKVMADFRERRTDVLVCTTVIEVGVDVPNASVMLIESAERFGLSQLHQLRGRVGRGAAKSWCFLITGYARSEESRARLEVMENSTDGFVIAERDLELRGPGEFLGTRQSGIPELAVANLARDQALLAQAQDDARAIVGQDQRLERPEHARLVRALEDRWEGRLKLARVG